jgi:CDP-glucose 4,6-dehydratase
VEDLVLMPLDQSFWKDRRVLVTGHTGFKGSWLIAWLSSLGAIVIGAALPVSQPENLHFAELDLLGAITHREIDIRNAASVIDTVRQENPEIVFHLAAQPLVGVSYADPVGTFAANTMGTVHLLEAARSHASVKTVVVVTTDKCYENLGWDWGYRENDRLGGHDPYSASKAAAEIVVSAYRSSFFSDVNGKCYVGVASARAGNVIGGGDFTVGRLVPDAIDSALRNESCFLRNPLATRPWQHVLEPLHGYLLLAQALSEGVSGAADAWNFGPDLDDVASAHTVALDVASQWGSCPEPQVGSSEFHEAAVLALDSTRAKLRLGWRPILKRRDAVAWTVEWSKRRSSGQSTHSITTDQISRYESLLEKL